MGGTYLVTEARNDHLEDVEDPSDDGTVTHEEVLRKP